MASSDLEFFNSISAHLDIELSIPAQQVAPHVLNLQSPPDAKIVSLKLTPQVYDEAKNEFRALTADELDSIAFRGPEIRLRGESDRVVSHKAPMTRSLLSVSCSSPSKKLSGKRAMTRSG
jgi:hypothetical protein